MPGFGSGPFGRDPFGEWGWSRNVLFESMPETYKRADVAEGGLLRKYTEGQQPSFENLRQHIQDFASLRDPFTVRTDYTDYEYVVLGKQVLPVGTTEQAGALGVVYSQGTFTAQDRTAKFVSTDIGKQLVIRRSSVQANNQQTFTITSIINEKEVFTDPVITVDSGPMRWEMRSQASLPVGEVEVELRGGDPTQIELGWVIEDGTKQSDVVSRQMYWQPVTSNKLLNEREGTGTISRSGPASTVVLTTPDYSFQLADVGKTLCIADTENPRDVGLWEIADVQGGQAILGKLTVPGSDNNVHGKIEYSVQATADRRVTLAHVYVPEASLTLALSYDLSVAGRFDIAIRLATDGAAEVTTVPSDIVAAVAADPVISKYVLAYSPTAGPETPVGLLDRVAAKTCPETSSSVEVFWSLRPFPRLVLQGDLPLGVIDLEGYDLSVVGMVGTGMVQVQSVSPVFRPGDVGKLLTVRGSTVGNDGSYEILSYLDSNSIVLAATLIVEAGPLYWARRTAPRLTASTTRLNALNYEVQAHAQSLIEKLAYDFGITVDRQQVEVRQRNWVRQISQWTAIKGTEDSVRAIASLSGFDCDVIPLFSIPAHPAMPTGSSSGYALYFIGNGRAATTGSLTQAGSEVAFSDLNLTFTAVDEGRVIVLNSATSAANNNIFCIKQYVSAHTVYLWPQSLGANFGAITTLVAPDANNGNIHGTVGEVYTNVEPRFLRYDEVDADYIAGICDLPQAYVPQTSPPSPNRPRHNTTVLDRPGIDTPCDVVSLTLGSTLVLPEAVNSGVGDSVVSVVSAGTEHTLTVSGDSLSVFLGGSWKLTDSAGYEFYADIPPVLLSAGVPVPQPAYAMPVTISSMDGLGGGIPPRMRVVSPSHGLVNGDTVSVSGVIYTGPNNPNSSAWSVTNVTVDTFELLGSDSTAFIYISGGVFEKHYLLNTYPAAQYSLTLTAATPPALGPVAFEYLCPLEISCELCPTYKVVISLSANQVLEEGNLANENAFQRCINLIEEALPAHVVAVYELSTAFSTRRLLTGIISSTVVI